MPGQARCGRSRRLRQEEIAVELEVDTAHHPFRSWKDFFLHLLTITIGLFIALTLQAAVESVHHRHLVRDARQNLRHEIEANHKVYAENSANLQKNRERLQRDIEVLRDLRSGKNPENPGLAWTWDWNSYDDAFWRTARDIGAISYMDSKIIERYNDIYIQQDYVNAAAIAIINDEPKIGAPWRIAQQAVNLTPAQIDSMLMGSAEMDIRLGTLQVLMRILDEMYKDALKDL
jgi:hypothetical protein